MAGSRRGPRAPVEGGGERAPARPEPPADGAPTAATAAGGLAPDGAAAFAEGPLRETAAALAATRRPALLPVRHHSPVCAAAMEAWLEAADPDHLYVELPVEAQPWLPWLAHPEAEAPLAVSVRAAEGHAFYPFADFSPELVALRWARRRGVPVEAFDLPVGTRGGAGPGRAAGPDGGSEEAEGGGGEAAGGDEGPDEGQGAPLTSALLRRTGAPDSLHLWDRLVETPGVRAEPEELRRAVLAYGLALRSEGVSAENAAREGFMCARLRAGEAAGVRRPAAVVGAFHAAALWAGWGEGEAGSGTGPGSDPGAIAPPDRSTTAGETPSDARVGVVASLLPYRHDLLDARSGYPAGVLDPAWQLRLFRHLGQHGGASLDQLFAATLVDLCRELRRQGHVAGPPDAAEALRVAFALASLRGRDAPGREELLEALELALAQGEPAGRGRALAKARERVLVGQVRGRLAPGTPRSGLALAVEALLTELRLPVGKAEAELVRLDPLRSPLDRRRHVTLRRLEALDVPYGTCVDRAAETLTHAWSLAWSPATDAAIAAAGAFGAELDAAVEGWLTHSAEDEPEALVTGLSVAAECGLPRLVAERLARLVVELPERAPLPVLVRAVGVVDRVAAGHVPGLLEAPELAGPAAAVRTGLYTAGVAALEGLLGSERPEDTAALLDLVHLAREQERAGDGRLAQAVGRLRREGAPRMAGAALVAAAELGLLDAAGLGNAFAEELRAAEGRGGRERFGGLCAGFVESLGEAVDAEPECWERVLGGVAGLPDRGFLDRLPALRGGFDTLSPATRGRVLAGVAERLGGGEVGALAAEPGLLVELERAGAELAGWWEEGSTGGSSPAARHGGDAPRASGALRTDLAGGPSAVASDPHPPEGAAGAATGTAEVGAGTAEVGAGTAEVGAGAAAEPAPGAIGTVPPGSTLDALTRWRLVLGLEEHELPPAVRGRAAALDQLYGAGRGEGAGNRGFGGRGSVAPTPREWGEQLEEGFGAAVREEVLAAAASRGDVGALLELDPEVVLPSVALLEAALALRGGLPEASLTKLRRLCERVTAALAEALAVRVRPALSGLALPRPSRRPLGPLDLRRTLARNLAHTRRDEQGRLQVVPERLWFRTRGRRTMDWHVVLIVDTSGSMEPSTVHAALMAGILAGLPALRVHFYGFAEEVVDFSEHVDDPLGLLLEVRVGGGTRIARALRYARERLTVPARSLVVLVTDFEEGGPTGPLVAEVRALAEAGAKLLGVAALDEQAKPRYHEGVARRVVEAGMPVAAVSPVELARWVAEQVRGG